MTTPEFNKTEGNIVLRARSLLYSVRGLVDKALYTPSQAWRNYDEFSVPDGRLRTPGELETAIRQDMGVIDTDIEWLVSEDKEIA